MLTECHYTNRCSRWRRESYSHSFSAVPYLHWTGLKDWPLTSNCKNSDDEQASYLAGAQSKARAKTRAYFRQLSNWCVVIHTWQIVVSGFFLPGNEDSVQEFKTSVIINLSVEHRFLEPREVKRTSAGISIASCFKYKSRYKILYVWTTTVLVSQVCLYVTNNYLYCPFVVN